MGVRKSYTSRPVGQVERVSNGGVIDRDLSDRLFLYRVHTGYTQRELAQKISVHQAQLALAEQAKPISLKLRFRLAQFLAGTAEPASDSKKETLIHEQR